MPSDLQRTFTKAPHGPDERWGRADWTPRAPGTVWAAEDGPPPPGRPRPCPAARPPTLPAGLRATVPGGLRAWGRGTLLTLTCPEPSFGLPITLLTPSERIVQTDCAEGPNRDRGTNSRSRHSCVPGRASHSAQPVASPAAWAVTRLLVRVPPRFRVLLSHGEGPGCNQEAVGFFLRCKVP